MECQRLQIPGFLACPQLSKDFFDMDLDGWIVFEGGQDEVLVLSHGLPSSVQGPQIESATALRAAFGAQPVQSDPMK